MRTLIVPVIVCALIAAISEPAGACGCFNPPDPIQPLVQTGERILFRAKNGTITAHIQIAFAGKDTTQFGWTVPLPSVPTLEVGDDAVFTALADETGGQYNLKKQYDCHSAAPARSPPGDSGCGFRLGSGSGDYRPGSPSIDSTRSSPNVLVIRSTAGPYDFAVLKADDKNALINWLNSNRFFLPTASDDLLKPYIGPGLYFLALKMRPGSDAGDIKPIVLTYSSDLPMIPLTLTSATVAPQLPVLVWMLGDGRAVPRNYHHVVLNDALLDWRFGLGNYDKIVNAAVREAPGGHGFITEFAGPSSAVKAKVPERYASLFEGAPTLTRLYTVLEARSLDKDPVFSTNPDLPAVSRTHDATLTVDCDDSGSLHTELGFDVPLNWNQLTLPPDLPAAERIEILREEGRPEVIRDNHAHIVKLLGGTAPTTPRPDAGTPPDDGSVAGRQTRGEILLASLLPLLLLLRTTRRRP